MLLTQTARTTTQIVCVTKAADVLAKIFSRQTLMRIHEPITSQRLSIQSVALSATVWS